MEEPVASTNSNDQDERIRARRLRIEKRNISRTEEGNKSKNADPEDKQKSRRKQQVAGSLVTLDRKKAETIEEVTRVRIEADSAENARRIQEEERRQRRLHALQGEALSSGKKNAAVEMRWAELMEHNMPLDLRDEVERQRRACSAIISSKDKLVEDLQRELKGKDEEYVRALKKQGDDIEQLLGRMAKQYKELQSQYEHELEAIEEAFLAERKELIESNRAETDALFEKRRVMEMNYMEARQEREANYQQELNELRTKDAEDYNQLKIKLETDIQTLEQQLEEMRATYQLNTEKLEYNYRVLTERDMENSATLGQQKRKLARLKDALSTLTSKYHTTDTKFKEENMLLTLEYRRITKQYKDLQSKFRHFEIADNKKYREVWAMHREEILDQVNQLLSADQIIQVQQLGHRWEAPDPELLECRSGTFGAANAIASASLQQQQAAAAKDGTQGSKEEVPAPALSDDAAAATSASAVMAKRSKVSNAKVKVMLELLCEEATFLVDPKLKEQLAGMDKEKASVLRADSILKALCVENESDIQSLLAHFFEKVDDDEEDAFALEAAEDRASQIKSLGLKVKPDDVVKVIKQFVSERNRDGDEQVAAAAAAAASAKRKKRENRIDEEQRASDARRERDRKEEIEYWARLADVVPDRTIRVWESLEQALQKYNKVLSERSQSVQEVSRLKVQNDELKALLNQYLGSQVVQDLLVPPMETTAVVPDQQQQQLYR